MPEPLAASLLRLTLDPESVPCTSTAVLKALEDGVGQERALDALRFGIDVRHKGYNIFAVGPSGVGRRSVVLALLRETAARQKTPDDYCYVHNFGDARTPRVLRLPPGRGSELARDMQKMTDELQPAIIAAFETDDYRARHEAIDRELDTQQSESFAELREFAEEQSIGVAQTPTGFAVVPLRDGEVLPPQEAEKLPEEEQERITKGMIAVQERLRKILEQVPKWQKAHRAAIRTLDRMTSKAAIQMLLDEVRARYMDLSEVLDFLEAVEHDVVERVRDLVPEHPHREGRPTPMLEHEPSGMQRYRVNVIVDQRDVSGAPIVVEDHPSVANLIGKVEHTARMGLLTTDYSLIKPGAFHQANGGYLIIDARKILLQPLAWEELKHVLRAGQVKVRSMLELMGLTATVSLEPEPIPIDLKVILIGEPRLFYLLSHFDPDLAEHFKVVADFEDDMPRDQDRVLRYARLMAKIIEEQKLLPLGRAAIARVVDEASRWASGSEKVSLSVRRLCDLLVEANHVAKARERARVEEDDVQAAIDAAIRRRDRLRDRIYEAIEKDTLHVLTDGEVVGQINALSVLDTGELMFGRPSRVTARTRLGTGKVIDIEREVELGGAIHSKGVMILSGYLGSRYASDDSLSLSATLVFEQSYGGVDGDSASLAELCAILSSLSELPIRQSIAITGSVDQLGSAQAIGGVNEKIEGFFDVCQQKGLSGHQGVIIPRANSRHLFLREDVVEAARQGSFHVYAVEHVDEAIALLTGVDAGVADAEGRFPSECVHGRVQARLSRLREAARAAAKEAQMQAQGTEKE